jgi:hypothetical protein
MTESPDPQLQFKKRARRRLVGAIAFAGLAALDRAVESGRLSSQHAAGLLPPPINEKGAFIAGLIGGPPVAMPNDPEFRRRIAGLIRQLKGGEKA